MSTLVYSFHPDVPASEFEWLRPRYASAGAACFDVFAFEWLPSSTCRQRIARTGLIFDLPAGNCLEVYSRSGHGFRHGIRLANGVGIIDSDYTGELLVALVQDGQGLWPVLNGAIAQCRLGLASKISLSFGEVNKQTARGVKGFGSTDIGEI